VFNSKICVFADLFSSSFRPAYDGAFLFRVRTAYHNSGILGQICDALPLNVLSDVLAYEMSYDIIHTGFSYKSLGNPITYTIYTRV
jgi:hypothetical protein